MLKEVKELLYCIGAAWYMSTTLDKIAMITFAVLMLACAWFIITGEEYEGEDDGSN